MEVSPTPGGLWLVLEPEGPLLNSIAYLRYRPSITGMDLPAGMQKDVGVSHSERPKSATEVRQVQNVALADATAKAGVSPWTPSMFKVSEGNFLWASSKLYGFPQPVNRLRSVARRN